MKITKLNAFALPEATVLRIETDSGVRGYGECRRLSALVEVTPKSIRLRK